MDRSTIISAIINNKEHLNRIGVRSLGLFGSLARNEAATVSDVDLLVELEEPVTFERYMDVRIFLEDLLQCKVDLVIKDVVREPIRPYIEKDLIRVA